MIITCSAADCSVVIEITGSASSSVTFTCRTHTQPSSDDVRFQTYQFDERLMGTGTDPRAYEQRPQPKKSTRKFGKTGRPRKARLEKLKLSLEGVANSKKILKVLKQDLDIQGLGE